MSAKEEVNETATASNGESKEEKSPANGADTADVKTDALKEEEEEAVEEETEEFESAPDDLNDFVVLDEAEITDGEEDEDEEEPKGEDPEDGKQWDCPVHRLAPRTYKRSDLEPTELDTRCKPDWPLAGYWPVYVGNFYMPKRNSDYNCMFAVHKYFASKGLPAFMVFRLKDEFFENYQKRVGFYDMLVYFINKKDATRAINWCHRDMYWGHKLKVYCGRTTAQANTRVKNKSFKIKHLKSEDKLETETNLAKYMRRYGDVLFIGKHSLDHALVQLSHPPPVRSVSILHDPRIEASPIKPGFRKQRFVEEDVMEALSKEIADNPKFMRSRLRYVYLKLIMHGVIPEMNTPWAHRDFKEGPKHVHPHPNTRPFTKEVYPPKRRRDFEGYGNGAPQPKFRRDFNEYGHVAPQPKFKRDFDDYGLGPSQPKSRRQLVKEAKSLESQLRAVQSKIAQRHTPHSNLPPQKKITTSVEALSPYPEETKPKGKKSENQLIRQRIRQSRRRRGQFDDILMDAAV